MNFSECTLSETAKHALSELSGYNIPHALILEGNNPDVLMDCAKFITMYLVCTSDDKPCGKCGQCHKASLKEHADINYVTPENKSKSYSIKQMRKIIQDAFIMPNEADAKVYVFEAADKRLSTVVQNSFLKLLEESPKNVYFILLCESSNTLLTTILSRCTVLRINSKIEADDDCVEGAKAILNGIVSPREYDLLSAIRVLLKKDKCEEVFTLINLWLNSSLEILCDAKPFKDDEVSRKIITRCTKEQIIKLIELTNDANLKVKQNINMNLLTTWLCGEYRRISWQR